MMILLQLSEHLFKLVFSFLRFIMRTYRGICLRAAYHSIEIVNICVLKIILREYSLYSILILGS